MPPSAPRPGHRGRIRRRGDAREGLRPRHARGRPEFARIVEGAKKNRAAGDAAVVGEGLFVSPGGVPKAILVLLHEVNSDPMSVARPFMGEAKARGLYVVAPRVLPVRG